jgi:hypothetical protein
MELLSLLCGLLGCVVNEAEETDIVLADMLHNFPVRPQLELQLRLPRLGIRLRVVDREVDLQGVMAEAPDALHKMHGVAVWITFPIERSFVVKADRIGNQRWCYWLASQKARNIRATGKVVAGQHTPKIFQHRGHREHRDEKRKT